MDLHQENRRRRRGKILRALNAVYPTELVPETFLRVLAEWRIPASIDKVTADLAYLADKGYVTVSTVEIDGAQETLVRLSAQGKDLVEGSIVADPGVEL
jgi:hypothetical protein